MDSNQVKEAVNVLNRILQMPVSEVAGHVGKGVTTTMRTVTTPIRWGANKVAETKAGQVIVKGVKTPAVRVVGRVAGEGLWLLLLTDGSLMTKAVSGDLPGAFIDIGKSFKDLGKAIVSSGEEREQLFNSLGDLFTKPGEVAEAVWDGLKMTGQSVLMAIKPDSFMDMKIRMGHVEKPITDKNGKLVIKDGQVRTGDVFYMAMQDKIYPDQFYFFERMGSVTKPVAGFKVDKNGRILSEYHEYSNEIGKQRTVTEYDSTNVTSLKKRYGIDLGDFKSISPIGLVNDLYRINVSINPVFYLADSLIRNSKGSISTIGKPKKIVTETVLNNNRPKWDTTSKAMNLNDQAAIITRSRTIRTKQTEYPVYFKDGQKIANDVVVENNTQVRVYFMTEEDIAYLCEINNSNPEKSKEELKKILDKKDIEKQKNPKDTRICQDIITEDKVLYSREYYTGNPDLKNVKKPHDDEFFNQYNRVLARKESYTDKSLGRCEGEKEVAEPLNSQNVSIGSPLAHDDNGHVIRGRLDYKKHQVMEGISTDSAYDYMGEKAVFIHRKNKNGQAEVAQMIRVNSNTGVMKEFDADGNFVDVHVPKSKKHDELALAIQSAVNVQVPEFDEKAAKNRLAAAREQEEENSKNKEKANQERLTEGKQEENTKNKEKSNLLTALNEHGTEHREENSSLDLTNNNAVEVQR